MLEDSTDKLNTKKSQSSSSGSDEESDSGSSESSSKSAEKNDLIKKSKLKRKQSGSQHSKEKLRGFETIKFDDEKETSKKPHKI